MALKQIKNAAEVNLQNEIWVEVDGSIFTQSRFEKKLEFQTVVVPLGVAYNLGKKVAQHVVSVHNASLSKAE